MGTKLGTGKDVVSYLINQHQQVKTMFSNVASSHGEERTKHFQALRRTLAVHETAEEEIVHPAARKAVTNGDAIVEARLREENEAKKALAVLETLDVDSAEFETKFAALREAVLAHATAEESEEFAQLATELDPARLERMRKAAEVAEAIAPTRPHPGVESATANILAGPFASMLDRARDAISNKH